MDLPCPSDDIGSPDWIDLHLQNLSLQHVGSLFGCRADDVIRPMALSFGSAELEDSVVSDRAAAAAGDLPLEAAVAAAESAVCGSAAFIQSPVREITPTA